jgi:hypothetical protein
MNKALDDESCVLITGSKFFRAPPFCGAVIIPVPIMAKLVNNISESIP